MQKHKRVLAAFLAFLLLLGLAIPLGETAEAFTPAHSIIRIRINGASGWRAPPNVRLDNADGLRIGSFNAQREFVQDSGATFNRLTVTASGSNITVQDGAGNTVHTGTNFAIAPVNRDLTTTYTLPNSSFGVEGRTHFYLFGGFRFTASGGHLTVTNYVDIDHHVMGVVPYEAIPSWPIDALKAQALAARTFAVANFGRHGQAFDLCNGTHCHVYRGQHRANANTNRSVTETRGEIILHNGRPIEAFYHSASGGATERSENVWVSSRPYLLGVRNSHEAAPAELRWSRTFTPAELLAHMRARDSAFNLPDIVDVIPTYTEMGNMFSVRFVASNGRYITYSRERARTRIIGGFRFNSQRFTITRNDPGRALETHDEAELELHTEAELENPLGITNTLAQHSWLQNICSDSRPDDWYMFYSDIELLAMAEAGLIDCLLPQESGITPLSSGVTFTIRNYGFGHNVGMSQHGAASLARMGYNYRQIIHFYYQNVTISGHTGTPDPPPGTFADVSSDDWYYDAVNYVRSAGFMQGTSNTTFSPYDNATRGMFITILGRMEGINPLDYALHGTARTTTGVPVNIRAGPGTGHAVVGSAPHDSTVIITGRTDNWYRIRQGNLTGYMSRDFLVADQGTFSDVRAGAFYTPYVEWAYTEGVATGSAGAFHPNRAISRQEMATLLHRYIVSAGILLERDTEMPPFNDIDSVQSWATQAVTALQQAGLIQGMGCGNFVPLENSNRASVAMLFMNFHQRHG